MVQGSAWGNRPSHVCGAMKSRGASTPADSTTAVEVVEAEEREGRTPLDRLPPARNSALGWTPQFPSNERWSPVTLMRSSHPKPVSGGGCGYDKPTYLSVDGVF
jgi:hypothetical protein